MKPDHFVLVTSAAALVTGLLAVSSQSLWIDEAGSAVLAKEIDPLAFTKDRGSTLQMPLYMLMLWGWEKVFGHSEFALRAMNIPLFVVAMLVTATCWNASTMTRAFFLAFACSSAFVWAYLDEARPYILQFLGASLSIITLRNLATSQKPPASRDLWLFSLGIIVLCGSSLIGVIFAFWFALAYLAIWLPREPVARISARHDFRLVATITTLLLLFLGLYYVWTLRVGAAASGIGKTSLLNLGFVAYELFGFTGFGPGRTSLRESLWPSLVLYLPYLAIYGFALSAFAILGIEQTTSQRSDRKAGIGKLVFWSSALFAAATVYFAGQLAGFRLVGRHFTPLMPFLLICFALAGSLLWARRESPGRLAVVVLLLLSTASALAHRFGDQHAKDDYRRAALTARRAVDGRYVVWWAADRSAAEYYGLPTKLLSESIPAATAGSGAFMANNRSSGYLSRLPSPSLVVLSKKDVYDEGGFLRQWLETNGYALSDREAAFDFFTPPSGLRR